MKLQKPKQTRLIGGAASCALLLALTGCGGSGGGEDESATAAKGPPANSNSQGASIAVSNTCELADTDTAGNAIKPVLRVTTTITDKSSGDVSALFNPGYIMVTATEKEKRKPKYAQVGTSEKTDGSGSSLLGVTVTDIQLCDGTNTVVSSGAVSLNASVSVEVSNDNKAEYSNRCSDDPLTDGVDEGKVLVSPDALAATCMLP